MSNDPLTMIRGWVVPQEIDERSCPDALVSVVKCFQERLERLITVGGGKDRQARAALVS
jgi:hypothetical protein